jgi:Cu/Ag efflux pump CusA
VSLVVLLFLFHWRSALSILLQIPITIATSFILLNAFGISSNIMSLTGIALAIGVIVDNGIVMTENAYRNLALHQAEEEAGGPPGAGSPPPTGTTATSASTPTTLTPTYHG